MPTGVYVRTAEHCAKISAGLLRLRCDHTQKQSSLAEVCVVCGEVPKYLWNGVTPLSKKGECVSCVFRRSTTRRWREQPEVMHEYRKRAAKTHVGLPLSPETPAKVIVRMTGKKRGPYRPWSPEARARMSAALRGRRLTPSHKVAAALGQLRGVLGEQAVATMVQSLALAGFEQHRQERVVEMTEARS